MLVVLRGGVLGATVGYDLGSQGGPAGTGAGAPRGQPPSSFSCFSAPGLSPSTTTTSSLGTASGPPGGVRQPRSLQHLTAAPVFLYEPQGLACLAWPLSLSLPLRHAPSPCCPLSPRMPSSGLHAAQHDAWRGVARGAEVGSAAAAAAALPPRVVLVGSPLHLRMLRLLPRPLQLPPRCPWPNPSSRKSLSHNQRPSRVILLFLPP